MRRLAVGLLMMVAALVAGAPRAHADDAMWRTFRGRVLFSDMALAPAFNFGSGATMTSALQRIERSTIEQSADFWRIHILAFLDRPAASDRLIMRAYDIGAPREAKNVRASEPRQVRVFEVPVERGAREVRLDDFVVTPAMGFERGVSYEMSIEAPPEDASPLAETKKAGKADVYAKGVITLR
jgi:hypothetical protein